MLRSKDVERVFPETRDLVVDFRTRNETNPVESSVHVVLSLVALD